MKQKRDNIFAQLISLVIIGIVIAICMKLGLKFYRFVSEDSYQELQAMLAMNYDELLVYVQSQSTTLYTVVAWLPPVIGEMVAKLFCLSIQTAFTAFAFLLIFKIGPSVGNITSIGAYFCEAAQPPKTDYYTTHTYYRD